MEAVKGKGKKIVLIKRSKLKEEKWTIVKDKKERADEIRELGKGKVCLKAPL